MIEVLQTGTLTTVQDAGRPGNRHLGIPSSGAADRLSFALANWMVGNPWDTPALECTLGGLHLRFDTATMVALAGAEMWAQVNGQNVENFTAFPVNKGDILTLSFARQGCRAYVAVAGGFDGTAFFDSVSTYLPAKIGGVDGDAVKVGDTFLPRPAQGVKNIIPPGFCPRISNHAVLRTRPGPEYDYLTADSQRHLFISPFIATPETDRMGSRLRGDAIKTTGFGHMISGPMLPGTLQVPADGQPILALVDGHCTGGYPRILQVIKADLWLLGQIGPGMRVSFQRCFDAQAPKILKHRTAFYSSLIPDFSF